MILDEVDDQVSGISIAIPLVLLAILLATVAVQSDLVALRGAQNPVASPDVITVVPRSFAYRDHAEYFRAGFAVDAPRSVVTIETPLTIMKYQVSRAEYDRCVQDKACSPAESEEPASPDKTSVIGVSYDDALHYAAWLSDHTGHSWTLPTDEQLAFAAGSRFPDDALGVTSDGKNPAIRWLADYEREARRAASKDPRPQIRGTFGVSEYGLADFAGNIWEWTRSCSKRVDMDAQKADQEADPSRCGILIASGKHRAPMSSFIRNPKGGGCTVGSPPDNLGFRLVRQPSSLEMAKDWIRRMIGLTTFSINAVPPDEGPTS
ncbi:SUMF1/EgtB/PvdO family nonheme iron enzyme [Rhizobium sullae]|uniref:SUMF1/EgtB/PvdO family nonheme iron enzyme n=1 Tax=Rhizobium sullae TaxID=50338 RepID=UPI000B36275C|nr:formylglycine-generating enzyme family protein [Rhizobium sullae]